MFTKFHKQTVHIDSVKAEFGNGGDLAIQHNATNSLIENYTGDLYIKNNADDKDIIFQSDDGSGGVTAYITLDGSAGYTTVQKNMVFADSASVYLGTSADLQLVHDGSNSTIQNNVGNLTIRQDADDGDIVFKCDDGSGGTETYFYLDGSAGGAAPFTVFPDSSVISCGGGHDLRIEHTGSYSRIRNYTGNMNIDNYGDDTDIIFQNDDGSGGITPYITLDGSQTTINLQKNVLIGTTTDSGVYKLDVAGKARVQSVFELDDVLTLNQISTPADPAAGKSSIYMDSADGAIKVKINVGGTVVTRTIASFE